MVVRTFILLVATTNILLPFFFKKTLSFFLLLMWNAMINSSYHFRVHLISQEKKVNEIVCVEREGGYKYSAATGGAAALVCQPPARLQEPASAASLLRPHNHNAPTFIPSFPAVRSPTRGPIPHATPPTPLLFSSGRGGRSSLGFRSGHSPPAQSSVELEDTRSPGFFCGDLWCGLMEPKAALAHKPIEEAVENLKIDASTKASNGNLPAAKDASSSDAISCISSADAASTAKETEMNQGTYMGDQGMYYYGYYYPGSFGGWDENSYYAGSNGLEMHPTVVHAENGSYLCYVPGYENGYTAYSPVVPGTGVDGQYVSKEPYYSAVIPVQDPSTPGMYAQPIAYGPEVVPAYTWDPSYDLLDGVQGHPVGVHQTNYPTRPNYPSNKHAVPSSKASRSTKYASGTTKGSSSAVDTVPTSANNHPSSKFANKASGASITKGHLPCSKFVAHTNQGKGSLYQSKGINLNESGRNCNGGEKLKARSKLNEFGDCDISDKRNDDSKNNLSPGADRFGLSGVQEVNDGIPSVVAIRRDSYNLPDFVTKYEQALFFVIKSYSEDDIHKSIKYNVWASTPNGNKRLDNAYKIAQERMAGKGTKCPVFLFFSVNASGQFCGVAEMLGPVDFNKSMNFWQQDKWNGFFPVKWHIIKDVPNPQFRHIILENNENKPVTNSRDTQEVKFLQGAEMLNIFKNFSCKTSILDDFDFYENRQKVMQDRRGKPLTTSLDPLTPKDEKPAEFEKQAQSASTVEHHNGKRNEEQSNDVTADVDTAKRVQDQSNVVAADVDTAKTSEQIKEVATDVDTSKRSEERNGVAADVDASKRSEEQSNKVAAKLDTAKRSEEQTSSVATAG